MEKLRLNKEESNHRAETGMQMAIAHADAEDREWSTMAYEFLTNVFIKHHHGEFLCEQVRKACEGVVPEPPNTRAWGGILRKAAYAGLITKTGYRKVTNVSAHSTPAGVWRKTGSNQFTK